MIKYNKFWNLTKERGVSTYRLRENGVFAATITKLRTGGNIDTVTINKLCALLDCQPGDLMEYTPESEK